MQMGYDFDNERQFAVSGQRIGGYAGLWSARGEAAADGLAGAGPVHPDWDALRARFLAVHALRRTLAAAGSAAVPGGSFAQAAAAVLADCRSPADGVNPVYSGNGKAARAMIGLVADFPTPGDRGMQ